MVADVAIVGGGIAGSALAWQLAEAGAEVTLIEREPLWGCHSSGRNAAIWLPLDDDLTTPPLARRSAELLDGLMGPHWRTPTGAIVTAKDSARLNPLRRGGTAAGVEPRPLPLAQTVARVPALDGGAFGAALWVPGAATMDIHGMIGAIVRAAKAAGATLHPGTGVTAIHTRDCRVEGCLLADGTSIRAAQVVIAAGAWADPLGASCDAPLPLTPLRRHLAQLQIDATPSALTVWDVSDEVYFRGESGGLLASPCDEAQMQPCAPSADPTAADWLATKLGRLAPRLRDAKLRSLWACLRTFAPDRELVCGPDPRVAGLHWLAGLGGRGMTVGIGAAELTARMLQQTPHPLAQHVAVDRLLA